jgi:hypothetical protein
MQRSPSGVLDLAVIARVEYSGDFCLKCSHLTRVCNKCEGTRIDYPVASKLIFVLDAL